MLLATINRGTGRARQGWLEGADGLPIFRDRRPAGAARPFAPGHRRRFDMNQRTKPTTPARAKARRTRTIGGSLGAVC